MITSLFGPIYAKIDPIRVADGACGLEVGSNYALRILARYRPDLPSDRHQPIVYRLIHAYPSHGFVIDAEELAEIGIPARSPDAVERAVLDAAAMGLRMHRDQGDVFELVGGEGAARVEGEPEGRAEDGRGVRGAGEVEPGIAAARSGARVGAEWGGMA